MNELVVCDAMNYLERFFPLDEPQFADAVPAVLLEEAERRVRLTLDAARRSNLRLVFCFDTGQATEESKAKWEERRFAEVKRGRRRLPCGAEMLFAAVLEEEGATVVFAPDEMDGDDAVAALASRFKGHVLSRDRDMFRYHVGDTDRVPFLVSRDFGIHALTGRLVLSLGWKPPPHDDGRPLRDVKEILEGHPALLDSSLTIELACQAWRMASPSMCLKAKTGRSKRGNADCNTAMCGNLNALVSPLLSAVYFATGVTEFVALRVPEAVHNDAGEVVDAQMAEYRILPSKVLFHTASHPETALEWIQTNVLMATEDMGFTRTQAVSRAHAACMLAAEIADAMLYARDPKESSNDPFYSTHRRILKFYKSLSASDHTLQPNSGPESGTLPEGHAPVCDWAEVGKCSRLDEGTCASIRTNMTGVVFAHNIRHGHELQKPPICEHCVELFLRSGKKGRRKSDASCS